MRGGLVARLTGSGSAQRAALMRCSCFGGGRGAAGGGDAARSGDAAPHAAPQQAPRPAPGTPAKLRRTEAALSPPATLAQQLDPAAPPLRVLTFNILADGLAQHGDFVHAPPQALTWQHRLPLIVQEIAEARPDIVCLQEANHFDEIAAALAPLGLSGYFLPKRPAPPERFGAPPDGVALFWRAARLAPLPGWPRGAPYVRQGNGGAAAAAAADTGSGAAASSSGQGMAGGSSSLGLAGATLGSLDEVNGGKEGSPMTQGCVIGAFADAAAGGRRLVVAGTHLKAKEGASNEEARRAQGSKVPQHDGCTPPQAQQLAEQVAAAAAAAAAAPPAASSSGAKGAATCSSSSGGSGVAASGSSSSSGRQPGILVLGDFNAPPGSAACQALEGHPGLGLRSIWGVPWASAQPSSSGGAPDNGAPGGASSSGRQADRGPPAAPCPGADHPAASSGGAAAPQGGGSMGPPQGGGSSSSTRQEAPDQDKEFSTWKFRSGGAVQRTIDHVLWSDRALAPTARWRMLGEREIGPGGLPCAAYPSDHIAVCAQFGWLH